MQIFSDTVSQVNITKQFKSQRSEKVQIYDMTLLILMVCKGKDSPLKYR